MSILTDEYGETLGVNVETTICDDNANCMALVRKLNVHSVDKMIFFTLYAMYV